MSALGFSLFDSPVGSIAIAWSVGGIVGVQLPELSAAATHGRMRRRVPGVRERTPPMDVQLAIDQIVTLLRGEPSDLSGIQLDMGGVPVFHRRVYEAARRIPPGKTLTYGQLAEQLGEPGLARTVGQVLGRNPFPIIVPCHRVLAAGGRIGGFSANGGVGTKRRLLAIEGVELGDGTLNLFDEGSE